MLQTIQRKLQDIGLTINETDTYLSLLKTGPTSASLLARQARLDRTSTYRALATLLEKGLVSYEPNDRGTVYQAAPPDSLVNYINNKQVILNQQLNNAKELAKSIPAELSIISNVSNIQVMHGTEGIKYIWEDALSDDVTIQRQLVRTDVQQFMMQDYEAWAKDYIQRRVAKNIQLRFLSPAEWIGHIYRSSNKEWLKEVRILPDNFELISSIIIYGDKVATHTLGTDDNDIKVIIIQDKNIAATQASLFDFLWDRAKKT